MVTEKMIEALKPCPFCGCGDILGGYIRDGREIVCGGCHASIAAFHPDASKRAAERWNRRAEVALSTDAEPVGIQMHRTRHEISQLAGWSEWSRWEEGFGKTDDADFKIEIENRMFYADPPAPSVAVKALEWLEDGKYLRARMGDREYSINITADGETWAGATRPYVFGKNLTWSSVPNCSMVSLESAKAACQADCQSRYAALSAQVQDVAEYERREQVCKETAMSQWERSLKRPDLTEKDRVIGAVEAYKRQAFAFTMLSAAPAAKLEGKP